MKEGGYPIDCDSLRGKISWFNCPFDETVNVSKKILARGWEYEGSMCDCKNKSDNQPRDFSSFIFLVYSIVSLPHYFPSNTMFLIGKRAGGKP